MPVVFLEKKEPLARQVAEFLLVGINTLPIDLADTRVWVPTSGAGRRIREALATLAAARGTGVLSPVFLQPMQALLPEVAHIASRSVREAAWAEVLRETPAEVWAELIPDPTILSTANGALGIGGMFCDLCDLLAEGGLDPTDPRLAKICDEDAARWESWQTLYPEYLRRLEMAGAADPNALRLRSFLTPTPAFRRVIVACVPDLPQAAAMHLEALSRRGVVVEILVWKPADLPGGWDAFGRPLPDEWNAAALKIERSQIAVARETSDEARRAVDFAARAEIPGDYAIILADETLGAPLTAEIQRRQGTAFQPEGRTLADTEASRIALEWEKWQSGGEWRALRSLLQLPRLARWLGGFAKMYSSQLLQACDHFIVAALVENCEQAREYLAAAAPQTHGLTEAATLLNALDEVRRVPFSELLTAAWSDSGEGVENAARVLEIWDELNASPLYQHWPEGRAAALTRALRSERVFSSAPEGSVELSGWLEAPWLDAERLAICGCVEGQLPTSVSDHPFLPGSKRAALGLQDNARRLARDAYLLACLLARHQTGNLQLSYSRFDAEGSPTLPSRLLLRTEAAELPARVQHLFQLPPQNSRQPPRNNGWRWHLPEALRREHKPTISPSRCKSYLACPVRYYFESVLHAEAVEPDPREMDVRLFGLLIHEALEAFARKAPDESKAARIEKLVVEEFATLALRTFGASPTAAIRVQLESAKVRLRAFARVQEAEYKLGWRILAVEQDFGHEGDLPIGPLTLRGRVDRIERHHDLGLRIMDYKTSAIAKKPEMTHFGKADAEHFLPSSQVMRGEKMFSWNDLQLPLYRHVAEKLYPNVPVETAYFILPADPSLTAVIPLQLDSEIYQSALTCAEEIATQLSKGVFWPPQMPKYDSLGMLFLNGVAEDCFHPESIAFLKGKP